MNNEFLNNEIKKMEVMVEGLREKRKENIMNCDRGEIDYIEFCKVRDDINRKLKLFEDELNGLIMEKSIDI